MPSTTNNPKPRGEDQPLLAALVAEASRRGHTLAKLAAELGVTYERLAQWRRGEGSIASARRSVHERAGEYLKLPTVLVLVLAGQIGLADLAWPSRGSLRERLARELQTIRENDSIGPFVPPDLSTASDAVKLFVVFLCHELVSDGRRHHYSGWMSALHQASLDLTTTRVSADRSSSKDGSLF